MGRRLKLANGGPQMWSMSVDDDGHRTYKVQWMVETDDRQDGPNTILYGTPGLPVPGDSWRLGNDVDNWAFCQFGSECKPQGGANTANLLWLVDQTFSTKNKKRCLEEKVEDPLLEPPQIDFDGEKYTEEATHDIDGFAILTSSHEMIRGPQVEFDANRPTLTIKQNVATFYQAQVLPAVLSDCVNSEPMWGYPPRCVKLMPPKGARKYYGQCNIYYERTLKFDFGCRLDTSVTPSQLRSTWDKYILDEGHKVLNGHWENGNWVLDDIDGAPPDPQNPKHFIGAVDLQHKPMKVILDGFGKPAGVHIGRPEAVREYVCVSNDVTGQLLTDTDFFLPKTSGDVPWEPTDQYEIGNLVEYLIDGNLYIAFVVNVSDAPPGSSWILLPTGTQDRGVHNMFDTYQLGDVVVNPTDDTSKTEPGKIFVAKYPGVEFINALGLPATL